MALVSFLFLTTLLVLSLQHVNARDGQFFSKFTSANNNLEEIEKAILNDEEGPIKKPETYQNGYGLYGRRESALNPTTTATTYQPPQYKVEPEEYTGKQDQSFLTSTDTNNDDKYFYKKYFYNNDADEDDDTKFTKEGFNSMENHNNNNNNNNNNRYFSNKFGERTGLSDTRFIEGGKYFYDVNSDKYNPDLYGGSASASKGVNSDNNWSNSREYFGSSNNNVNNNANSYKRQNVFKNDQVNFDP